MQGEGEGTAPGPKLPHRVLGMVAVVLWFRRAWLPLSLMFTDDLAADKSIRMDFEMYKVLWNWGGCSEQLKLWSILLWNQLTS